MTACPSCGAVVRDAADRCSLCGTDLTAAGDAEPGDAESHPTEARFSDDPSAEAPRPAATTAPTECALCDHLNPAGARFCNACGATLVQSASTGPRAPKRPPSPVAEAQATRTAAPASDAGKRALLLVGAGVLAVVALYFITTRSGAPVDPTPATPSTVAGVPPAAGVPDGPAPPLPDSVQGVTDRYEAENTAQSWYEAGRNYLTAGFDAQQGGQAGDAGVLWIRRAMADFEKSLAIEENPDVRFALAETSQFDASDPMRPVVEIRKLLAEAPDHLGGNFLLGERRMLIGRLDSARVSFERVVALAPASDPLRARAQQRLAEIAQSGAGSASAGGAAGGGPAAPPTRGAPDGAAAAPPAGAPGPQ